MQTVYISLTDEQKHLVVDGSLDLFDRLLSVLRKDAGFERLAPLLSDKIRAIESDKMCQIARDTAAEKRAA